MTKFATLERVAVEVAAEAVHLEGIARARREGLEEAAVGAWNEGSEHRGEPHSGVGGELRRAHRRRCGIRLDADVAEARPPGSVGALPRGHVGTGLKAGVHEKILGLSRRRNRHQQDRDSKH